MWHLVLSVVQFVSCGCIIALVLIQRGKGADAGAGFGAGASGTVFGARGAGTALSRATAVLVAVFMLNSLALAYFGTRKAETPKTIFDTAAETAPASSGPLNITVPAAGAIPATTTNSAPALPAAPASSAPANGPATP
jgi:preprotein translocase subunit SecG